MKAAWIALIATGCAKEGAGLGADQLRDVCAGGERQGALVWHDDAYDDARACAKRRGVPVVVDMWAPWCHTCLSMSQYVLTDPSLEPYADRFVFAGIDTDKPENAAVVAALPIANWPTYFVVAPDGTIESRFVGAATLAQWKDFLDAGEAGFLDASGKPLPPGSPLAHVREGDRAAVAHDLAAADRAYGAALAAAPRDWPRRPDVLVAQIQARYKRGDDAGCLDLGLSALDQTGRSSSVTDFLVWALDCADARAKDDPARVDVMRSRAAARLRDITEDPRSPLSVDDRSDAMANLRDLYDTMGRHDEARAVAEKQRALLDDAAARAPDPAAASIYNWPREEVYVYLGRGLDLVPVLEKSVRDLPGEYDPPYRLAWLLLHSGQPDEAKLWIDKALPMLYGPRKGKALALAADIAKARGDHDGERSFRQQVVSLYAGLPKGEVSAQTIDQAKQALAAVK